MRQKTVQQLQAIEFFRPIFKELLVNINQFTGNDGYVSPLSSPSNINRFEMTLVLCVCECGFTPAQASKIVSGFDTDAVKCDLECNGGWQGKYQSAKVDSLLDMYVDRVLNGQTRFEVGFKYARFNKAAYIKKWGITGEPKLTFPAWTLEQRKLNPEYLKGDVPYELYYDRNGNFHSFEQGRMGTGGYSGFGFATADQGFEFVNWYMGKGTHSLKDVDLHSNGLGGLDFADFEYLNITGSDIQWCCFVDL